MQLHESNEEKEYDRSIGVLHSRCKKDDLLFSVLLKCNLREEFDHLSQPQNLCCEKVFLGYRPKKEIAKIGIIRNK